MPRAVTLLAGALLIGAAGARAEELGQTPPDLTAKYPGYFDNGMTTDVSSVRVEFGVPVTGVAAKDLTVNGTRATQVTGNAAGPYVFTGYARPELGRVDVTLAPGEIRRESPAQPRFEGEHWSFELLDAAADPDGDGLTNAQELARFTSPMKSDSDGDGMPDPYEETHPCLDPIADQAHPVDYAGKALPGDDDADDDGRTDLEEFKQGTDPCAAPHV